MPAQSIIVGVDLAPIKTIPRVISFQSDITTDKCRATIRQHLKTWKADTVLHDGAPNVGTAWVQDAFSQAELVLESLRLATDFLIEGGTFVTKVFRSKDYNPLLWVFKQLFASVEATKPPSSRNVSAEIFVVCRGYKAPKRIDPKFLDPKHVFAELSDPTPNNEAKVFNPEKKKRRREGYEEGDYTQFKEIPVTDFINTTDPIAILGSYNKLSFTEPIGGDIAMTTVNRLEETTDEIRRCCEDLKVLGKKEFRNLLKWRLKLREKFGLVVKKKPQGDEGEGEEIAEVAPMDEELAIQEELQRMRTKESTRDKKERRKENEKKRKEIVRLQMHMTTPMEIGMEQHGLGGTGPDSTFTLRRVDKAGARDAVISARDVPVESESEEESSEDEESDDDGDILERDLDSMYDQYQERMQDKDSKLRAKKARKAYETDEWDGFSEDNKSDASDNEVEEEEEEESYAAAPEDAIPRPGKISNNAALFFDQDIFQGVEDEEEEEEEEGEEEEDDEDEDMEDVDDSETEEEVPAPKKKNKKEPKKQTSEWVDSDDEPDHFDEPRKANGQLGMSPLCLSLNLVEIATNTRTTDIDIITAEAMALAHQMATGERKSNDIADDGFNRLSFRDVDGLPEWFLDDEGKHSKMQRPVTKAAAAAIKEKLRAINARPIKKVMEAKGRKKFKAAQKLEKLRKKSALLADDEALSERDKAQSISKLMSKATKKKPKTQVKLVVARGTNRGISGRPKGVKGRYKIVDARMKKDIRAQKRLAKKKA